MLFQFHSERSFDEVQIKELQDQLEAEQYFSSLYKTQVKELKEELEEKLKAYQDLQEERYFFIEQKIMLGIDIFILILEISLHIKL